MIGRIAKWFAAMPLLTGMAHGTFRAGLIVSPTWQAATSRRRAEADHQHAAGSRR
jgi:hypothetical protein